MTVPGAFLREQMIEELKSGIRWDLVVIGGGATGLGIALDAASRGFRTLLLERHDFAKGTSSRSTKLVHGGVRYLAQGNFRLVYDALYERGILLKNAPHLVKKQSFIIPCYSLWNKLKYAAGLKLYDLLAGKYNLGSSHILSAGQVKKFLPNIKTEGLRGAVEYFDGQFDDARLAIAIARTAAQYSAVLINYCSVTALVKNQGRITGLRTTDLETGNEYEVQAKAVINATGVFVDEIMKMDEPGKKSMVRSSQGVHIVVDKKFMNGNSALMIPETSDGRVLFAVPWQDHLIAGTTDTPLNKNTMEPVAHDSEVDFILDTIKNYLPDAPGRADVLSVFAGLRPLAAGAGTRNKTKDISRDHKLIVSSSGLVTITGGKWTTYRKMAEQTIDTVIRTAGLSGRGCITREIKIHGFTDQEQGLFANYGTDAEHILRLTEEDPSLNEPLISGHGYTLAEVVWIVRTEMARTVEDVLARRLRLLFLDARAAIAAAPAVANILAKELGRSNEWKAGQIEEFISLANNYQLKNI